MKREIMPTGIKTEIVRHGAQKGYGIIFDGFVQCDSLLTLEEAQQKAESINATYPSGQMAFIIEIRAAYLK